MSQQKIIGNREKATNGLLKAIFDFIFSGILFLFVFIFIVFLTTAKTAISSFGLVLGIISFIVLGLYFLFLGLKSMRITKNNDLILDKPCLSYLLEDKNFLIYNVEGNNEEIKLKEEDIVKIKGSLYKTFKELYVIYKTDNKIKKISVGFCKNIEEASFEDEIKKYLDKTKY